MENSIIKWTQIPSKDIKRAASFYENVFGATFFFEVLNGIPHAVFTKGRNNKKLLNGAIIEVKEPLGVGVVLFFEATGNFENLLDLIKENGGKVLVEKTLITKKENDKSSLIPNTYIDDKPGYFAHFIDSEGNKMGLYGSN